MSTRPTPRSDRTPPAPTIAARGVVLVVIAAALGLLLLAKALDGPSAADVNAIPGGPGVGGVVETTVPATTLPAATTTTVAPVYDPAVMVIVANASGVGGAAGRLTDSLGASPLAPLLGDPTNQPDGAPDVDETTVYYSNDAAIASAQAVANFLSTPTTVVEVQPLPSTDIVEGGDIQGAGVVVMLGRDLATTG